MIMKVARLIVPKKLRFPLRKWYISLRYLGRRVECPCCGGKFSKFLPAGVKRRENVLCPLCFSLERHRLLWLYLHEQTNIFKDQIKLLHVAPEYSLSRKLQFSPNIDYLSGDLYNPAMVKLDITNIQFDDHTFDVVICNHVLEHVPDDRKAMREIFRVLKPGGWAILQVPIKRNQMTFEDSSITSPEDRLRYFGQADHVRYYGKDYVDRLAEAGFKVKEDEYLTTIPQEIRDKYRLPTRGYIYFCNKRIKCSRSSEKRVGTVQMELQETIPELTTNIIGKGNKLELDRESVSITKTKIMIEGTNNKIVVGKNTALKNLTIELKGSNNLIKIGDRCRIAGKIVAKDDGQSIVIHNKTSFMNVHLLAQEGKNITIGEDCMFSRRIEVRTTDSHSVIDIETNERINHAKDIVIGNHVWVGADVTILKGVTIPDNTIIGANSVVTKSFEEKHCVIAGSPAKILKRGVTWDRKRI